MKRRDFLASVAALAMSPAVRLSPVGDGAITLTKSIDAAWATGVNSLDGNTWYHLFAIRKEPWRHDEIFPVPSMDNLADWAFSTDPSGGDLKHLGEPRRIGSVYTESSGNIRPFEAVGETFYWKEPAVQENDHEIDIATVGWHDPALKLGRG